MSFREWKKYLVTFAITAVIFGTTIAISILIDNARLNNIRSLQDNISLSILSSETQFNLLRNANCEDIFNSDLDSQLADIGNRLSFMESTGHSKDADFMSLKQYYYLLQIKNYMLISSATKCPLKPITILYFYKPDCSDCDKQGDVLNYLLKHHPDNVRIYSFDFSVDVPAVKTLADINKVSDDMPALVIDKVAYQGFHSLEDLISINPKMGTDRVRLVLSPHLDDAALSVGGLIARSTHTDNSPVIATVFTGMPKTPIATVWDAKSGFNDSTQAMESRVSENEYAANILHSKTLNMGYLDHEYRDGSVATSTLQNQIKSDIIKLIRNYDTSTSTMEVYGPAIFSAKIGHVDHTILHDAYIDAISEYKPRGIVTFFIYEDFPYVKNANVSRVDSAKMDLTKSLKNDAPQFSYSPIYIPLTDETVKAKENAIRSYGSQVKAMGSELVSVSTEWMKDRCKGLFKVPTFCEVVYQVQK